jgi:hypothetical protein
VVVRDLGFGERCGIGGVHEDNEDAAAVRDRLAARDQRDGLGRVVTHWT